MSLQTSIEPFVVRIPQDTLDDLHHRLERTRWPEDSAHSDWDHGVDLGYLTELVRYWQNDFDWRRQEREINRLAHYHTVVEGLDIHFIHERGKGDNPLPLVLTHGFPDSFLRFSSIIPMLTDPRAHGADPADAFDVVAPSLPGYGFSEKPSRDGSLFKVAKIWHTLMTETLSYGRFGAHGGDWGSTVTEQLARDHGGSLAGIHLTDVPFHHLFKPPADPSPPEATYLKAAEKLQKESGAYAMLQSTQPHTLGPALNDSPAGLAAWIIEKFRRWSDCGGRLETCFTKDELLANITLYWVTGTIQSSFGPYYDTANAGAITWIREMMKGWIGSSDVPAGFASFPKDILPAPREWAERFFDVQRWTEMPKGGHFAALEQPELLVEDIRAFFRPLRSRRSPSS